MHGGNISSGIDIDFSVSLNPYTDPVVESAIEEAAGLGLKHARSYPDIDQTEVRAAIAGSVGINPDCVIAANGSSELIMAAVRAFMPKSPLLCRPCFGGYDHALKSVGGCKIRDHYTKEEDGYALTKDVLPHMTEDIDLMFLCDPANPSGKNIDEELLESILKRADELNIKVILDESFLMLSDKYQKYTHEKTARKYIDSRNLIVIRSYTKCFALPGIRMGYALSCPENIKILRQNLPEWNLSSIGNALMSRLSNKSMIAGFLEKSHDLIVSEKGYLSGELTSIGFKVFDSNANFLLFKAVGKLCQINIYEKMIGQGILIRNCNDFDGLSKDHYRISVRDHNDNEQLIRALRSIL